MSNNKGVKMALEGPAKTIRVEPITVPAPAQEPARETTPTPQKDPVPA